MFDKFVVDKYFLEFLCFNFRSFGLVIGTLSFK